MERILVSFVNQNKEQKIKEQVVEVESLLSATRLINVYKPLRGYELIQVRLEYVPVLL